MTYVRVASVSDFPTSGIRKVEFEGQHIMIIRLGDEYHALDSTCTHEDTDLTRGIVTGEYITCPLHLSRFSIRTGEVDNPPAVEPLHRYELKLDGDDILLDL